MIENKKTRQTRKGLPLLTNAQRAKNNADTLGGRLNRLVIGARASAKQKGYDFAIDRHDMEKLWIEQVGICAYTNWPMSTKTKSPFLVSIDRIDSSKGYLIENIQLTCWAANRAKGELTEKEFLDMCEAITKHKRRL